MTVLLCEHRNLTEEELDELEQLYSQGLNFS